LLQTDPARYLQSPSRYRGADASQVHLTSEEIEALIQQRTEAKAQRDFAKADRIRDRLRDAGIELEDKAGGLTQWRRIYGRAMGDSITTSDKPGFWDEASPHLMLRHRIL